MFEWKDTYAVHIDSIDAQHRRLFQLAGQLHTAISAGEGQLALDEILNNLVDYTAVHFAHEEYLMHVHQYPHAVAHKAEHDALTRQVVEFRNASKGGRTAITFQLLAFFRNWLERHILQSDHQYAPYLRPKTV